MRVLACPRPADAPVIDRAFQQKSRRTRGHIQRASSALRLRAGPAAAPLNVRAQTARLPKPLEPPAGFYWIDDGGGGRAGPKTRGSEIETEPGMKG